MMEKLKNLAAAAGELLKKAAAAARAAWATMTARVKRYATAAWQQTEKRLPLALINAGRTAAIWLVRNQTAILAIAALLVAVGPLSTSMVVYLYFTHAGFFDFANRILRRHTPKEKDTEAGETQAAPPVVITPATGAS